jgi:xanthine dehydrogenase small subunit
VGLWVTKFMKPISPVVFVSHLEALKTIELTDEALTIGAGVTYTESEAAIREAFPHLVEYWDRIAGWQVRNMGTIGGNIANGSPIGDTPPVLIALGAEVTLRQGAAVRTLPLESFFIDYGKQDRRPGEFVQSIRIPLPSDATRCAGYKISKRRDEDISAVAAGISVTVEGGIIRSARIAFGGMAATPKRAKAAEAALLDQPWNEASFATAARAVAEDFAPLSDWRASAEYRMCVAQNLLRRFFLEQDGAPVRLSA